MIFNVKDNQEEQDRYIEIEADSDAIKILKELFCDASTLSSEEFELSARPFRFKDCRTLTQEVWITLRSVKNERQD